MSLLPGWYDFWRTWYPEPCCECGEDECECPTAEDIEAAIAEDRADRWREWYGD